MKETLEILVEKALRALSIEMESISFEHPDEMSHGDYSTNIALVLAKKLAKNPRDIANQIVVEIQENPFPKEISKVEVAGAGFINFYLSQKYFADGVKDILKQGKKFGQSKIGAKKKVLVEYSSPNIAKPFTVGHLRSTVIGDAVANISLACGYKVIRDNHLGDWGTQFGKVIVAIKKWGDESMIEKSKNPVKDLVDLYVKFHDEAEKDATLSEEAREWFLKLEKGDKEAKRIWKKCIDWSMLEFEKIYKRLGVHFDTTLGESFFKDKTGAVYEELEAKKLMRESEGARVVFFEDEKLPPLIVKKTNDTTIYAARDLAADLYRKEKYGAGLKIINEVGSEQTLYFRQIYEVEKMLGWFAEGERVHVMHGLYRFEDGKMSTRKGNVIWLEDILDEAVKRAGEVNPECADIVGIGAIKFNDLRRNSKQDIVFKWEDVLNLTGDSGPYIQYSAVRSRSVLTKAEEEGVKESLKVVPEKDFGVERLIGRFPEVVERACGEYAPHYIATYLIELSAAFNGFYGREKIVDATDEFSPYKVALSHAVSIVLENGLTLLGIQVPSKM
ncbi:MAG: arginine--tRNA ligase [Candidatus Pacebacteria bacterium]|nr:arginine--tRNA ligase [Candidatus Paceibacterota bacterium]